MNTCVIQGCTSAAIGSSTAGYLCKLHFHASPDITKQLFIGELILSVVRQKPGITEEEAFDACRGSRPTLSRPSFLREAARLTKAGTLEVRDGVLTLAGKKPTGNPALDKDRATLNALTDAIGIRPATIAAATALGNRARAAMDDVERIKKELAKSGWRAIELAKEAQELKRENAALRKRLEEMEVLLAETSEKAGKLLKGKRAK